MKGIILAGGSGTRLMPLTRVANKALLPVYDKPMIYYPIQFLVDSGIDDVLLVVGGNSPGKFLEVLGNGEAFGLKMLHYVYQAEPKGIADALGLAEEWAGGEPITVILADNLFENPVPDHVKSFKEQEYGARVFLSQVEHPEWYGVAIFDDGKLVEIQEKPKNPTSNWIVTGLYMYDEKVWDIIKTLEPSGRGELEITDVNNYYLKNKELEAYRLHGYWMDCHSAQ